MIYKKYYIEFESMDGEKYGVQYRYEPGTHWGDELEPPDLRELVILDYYKLSELKTITDIPKEAYEFIEYNH